MTSMYFNAPTSMIGAFLTGLLVDVWQGRDLGISSLQYVVVSFLIQLYKRKFDATSMWFFIPFTFAALIVSNIVIYRIGLNMKALLLLVQETSVFVVGIGIGVGLWKRIFHVEDLSV